MKKLLFLLAAISLIVFQSCDKIEGPVNEGGGTDTTTTGDSIVTKVFLEDYTGHGCQTCPRAHEEAQRLKDVYGDRLIIMAIHSSSTWAAPQPVSGKPYSFLYDFRSAAGNAISIDQGVINAAQDPLMPYPIGNINRVGLNLWSTWGSSVATALAKTAKAGLQVVNGYDSDSRSVSSTVIIQSIADQEHQQKLSVYLLEDSIVNWQKNSGHADSLYLHRHVLRGALTDPLGDDIGQLTNGQFVVKNFTGTLPRTDINAKKVYVVAVLTDNTTKEVIQVEEKKLTP